MFAQAQDIQKGLLPFQKLEKSLTGDVDFTGDVSNRNHQKDQVALLP